MGEDALKGGRTECIMRCNRGCTGGQDTLERGRMHSRGEDELGVAYSLLYTVGEDTL